MADYFDFVRITRDRRLDQLPVSSGVAELLKAVDRIALDMIASGSPAAFVDDGQALVAEISLGTLASALRKHEATARRRLQAAAKTPYLDAHELPGRPYTLCLKWSAIPDREARGNAIPCTSAAGDHPLKGVPRPPDARGSTPLAKCEGWVDPMQGVAPEDARGSTPFSAETEGGSRYPSHFLSDCEDQTNQLSAFCDSEHRGVRPLTACEGLHAAAVPVPALPVDRSAGGFFAAELESQLPWQRLEDEHLRTLDGRMLGLLYAEAIRSARIAEDTHDARKSFLAAAWHSARHKGLDNMRVACLAGRIRNRNYRRLMDQAWEWASGEMDRDRKPFGAGAHIEAAVRRLEAGR